MGLGQKKIFFHGMGLGHKLKKKLGWDGTRPIPFTSLPTRLYKNVI